MPEAKKADYEEAAKYAGKLEDYLGNFAAGIRFRTEQFPEDIKNEFREIAGEVRKIAEQMEKLSGKYSRKSETD